MVKGILDVQIGDVLVLKKPHPCGSNLWHVVRLGADIGVRCQGCRRRLLMPRSELARRLRSAIARREVHRDEILTDDRRASTVHFEGGAFVDAEPDEVGARADHTAQTPWRRRS